MPLRSIGALTVAAVAAVPLLLLVAGALNPPGDPLPRGLGLLPAPPSAESLSRAAELVPLGRQLVNSLVVVVIAVPLSVVVASWAGFALTQLGDRARRRGLAFVLVLLAIPASAVWTPRFVLLGRLDLVDTPVPLILPALLGTTPLAVLLCYWSFRRVPTDLWDAARMEGLSALQAWRRVGLPLVRPTTAAVGVLTFVLHWGNFADALLYLYTPDRYTLPLGLAQLRLLGPDDQSTILAGALIAAAPALVAFAVVQRRLFERSL